MRTQVDADTPKDFSGGEEGKSEADTLMEAAMAAPVKA